MAMNRAEQVRQVLATKGLTLYRVSQRSAEIFGRSSPFHIPHNLYYDIADPSSSPNIHQLFALSRITNYRLCDWLAVSGFDLDLIPRLALLIPRKRTILLDSSVYDTQVWIPWFTERPLKGEAPAIAPLRQLLASAAPRRAAELLGQSKNVFLYGRVGSEDGNAFPDFAPGSIVRVDTRHPEELLAGGARDAGRRFFLVEHASGWTCSQLRQLLTRDRIMLYSEQRPSCGLMEFELGKDARVLGVVDAEIRPTASDQAAPKPFFFTGTVLPQGRRALELPRDLSGLLRGSRMRAGLSFREASAASGRIASLLGDEHFFAAASTLSDYETLSAPPRHIQKAITLCALYCIDFWRFLRAAGLPLDQGGREPIPDELVERLAPRRSHDSRARDTDEGPERSETFLASLVARWEEVPLFLRHSLSGLTTLKNFSLSDVFWVGGTEMPMHPWLVDAAFAVVNRRIKKPVRLSGRMPHEPRLYMILERDGGYLCSCCALDQDKLVVYNCSGRSPGIRWLRNGVDAEIIGQVTAIVRRVR